MPQPPYEPNAEMALIGWLKTVPGLDPSKIATTLPGKVQSWAATGFVTVQSVGGSPNVHVPMRQPALSVNAWKALVTAEGTVSEKTPWGEAFALAETAFNAFYADGAFPARVEVDSFLPMSIRTGWPLIEPRKMPGSTAGFAHVQFDVQLAWTTVR